MQTFSTLIIASSCTLSNVAAVNTALAAVGAGVGGYVVASSAAHLANKNNANDASLQQGIDLLEQAEYYDAQFKQQQAALEAQQKAQVASLNKDADELTRASELEILKLTTEMDQEITTVMNAYQGRLNEHKKAIIAANNTAATKKHLRG